jgi:hypothetical protein
MEINTEEYLASGSVVAPCVVAECSSIRKARRMIKILTHRINRRASGQGH